MPMATPVTAKRRDQASQDYSEGLSVVYFLIHWGKTKGKKLLGGYIKALEEGLDLQEAYKKVFAKHMPKMEKSWKRAIQSLKF